MVFPRQHREDSYVSIHLFELNLIKKINLNSHSHILSLRYLQNLKIHAYYRQFYV